MIITIMQQGYGMFRSSLSISLSVFSVMNKAWQLTVEGFYTVCL